MTDNIAQLTVDAVERVMDNVRQSDFVTHAGLLAMVELRKYGADIACDVFETFAGQAPTEQQRQQFIQAFPQ